MTHPRRIGLISAITCPTGCELGRVADLLRASPNGRLALRPVVTAEDLASIRTREVTARIQRLQRNAPLASFEAAAAAL